MFKEVLEFWQGKQTLFDEVTGDFKEMLSGSELMFNKVTNALFTGEAMGDLKTDLYRQDSKLNTLEQTIRRRVMTLLSGVNEEPVAATLILMSISKDVERIGDYAKNILEVFQATPQLGKTEPYYGRLIEIKDTITALFTEVQKAYTDSDGDYARTLTEKAYKYRKLCDKNVEELLLAGSGEHFVAYALLSRFFKRILAHLGNVATSVFMPVTKVDFFDEIDREPGKDS